MKTILIILTVVFCSCSSVKKLKTSTHRTVDSSVVTNAHIQLNTKQDSTGLKMTGENHETKLEITFDSIRDYPQPYEAGKLPFTPKLHTIKIAGKEISSTQRMKLLTVMVSGETSVFDLTKNVKSDSSLSDSNKAVTVNKVEVTKSRSVERKGMKTIIAIVIILIIALGVYIYVTRKRKSINAIDIGIVILFALSSCKTTYIYNVRLIHDTVFVEKPVDKMDWGFMPNYPINRDTPLLRLPFWHHNPAFDSIVPYNFDSLLNLQRKGFYFNPALEKAAIDSSKTIQYDSIVLMQPFIKSNFFNSNPNYMPAIGNVRQRIKYETPWVKLNPEAEWHDAIISDGSDCDTCSNFIIISGDSSVKTIKGSIIIGCVDTGKAFINIGPCTNCMYLGTDSTIKNANL